jgi:hypothetical protein
LFDLFIYIFSFFRFQQVPLVPIKVLELVCAGDLIGRVNFSQSLKDSKLSKAASKNAKGLKVVQPLIYPPNLMSKDVLDVFFMAILM